LIIVRSWGRWGDRKMRELNLTFNPLSFNLEPLPFFKGWIFSPSKLMDKLTK